MTKTLLEEINPYAILVATGSKSIKPDNIKGINLPHVKTVEEGLNLGKALSYQKVCVIGAGAAGLGMIETLCENNNEVTVVEQFDKIGENVYVQHYLDAMDKLAPYNIEYNVSSKLLEIKDEYITIKNLNTNKQTEIEADYVILTVGVKAVTDILPVCQSVNEKVIVIGDAKEPGRIESAVRTGFEAAYYLD